jgi:hypothetical protein
VDLNYVQRCPSIMTPVANGSGLVVNPRTRKRHVTLPRERQPRISHHRTDAGPCIIE